jgi:hypothetical protein
LCSQNAALQEQLKDFKTALIGETAARKEFADVIRRPSRLLDRFAVPTYLPSTLDQHYQKVTQGEQDEVRAVMTLQLKKNFIKSLVRQPSVTRTFQDMQNLLPQVQQVRCQSASVSSVNLSLTLVADC